MKPLQQATTLLTTAVGVCVAAGPLRAETPALSRAGAIINGSHCIDCHSSNGVASDTRLVFPADDASDEAVADFGLWLFDLVDPDAPEHSRLYRKPTEHMSHAGGERVQKGTADDDAWLAWVQALAASMRTQAGKSEATAVLAHIQRPVAEKGGRVLGRVAGPGRAGTGGVAARRTPGRVDPDAP